MIVLPKVLVGFHYCTDAAAPQCGCSLLTLGAHWKHAMLMGVFSSLVMIQQICYYNVPG